VTTARDCDALAEAPCIWCGEHVITLYGTTFAIELPDPLVTFDLTTRCRTSANGQHATEKEHA
jgi:hypothetical protein